YEFPSEEKFYNFLGLDWIPPELREDTGEIGLAAEHKLPHLVELSDIKGDLQIHSNIDIEPSHDLGVSSIEELVAKSHQLGYEYIGITDHNPSVSNHSEKQIMDLIQERTKVVHSEKRVIHVFNGLEIDIQSDGRRALPDKALELLDYACVAIHSSFRLSRKAMTDRVLSAFDHPKVKFFAHPTGRLLQEREGVELDWMRIFDFCVENQKWLEIDGWPNRLDLPDVQVREAIKYGVKIVIDTDSHAADQLEFMRYGVSVARRGWATKSDTINTTNLTDMKKLLGGER
ncbi:MAG: PHP domain protein, partial [Candidatus Gottesmanbacteria bacterium GW2011_GWA1_48_13]